VLFKAAGDLIVGLNDLGEFCYPTLYGHTLLQASHIPSYKKLGNHIAAMKDLG
jgi:hypothetical protein